MKRFLASAAVLASLVGASVVVASPAEARKDSGWNETRVSSTRDSGWNGT